MKILVVGNGGREHALCWKLAASNKVDAVYCAPGNGGTAGEAKVQNLDISVTEFDKLADFAKQNKIGLVVIGPDNPLADGITDHLESHGLSVFGPTKEQSKLEWSKVHAKETMTRLSIPTANYGVFDNKDKALSYARENDKARVVKVDGLALGKGVMVCDNISEVEEALDKILVQKAFGEAGAKVIVEEMLCGEELSLLLLCDGKTLAAMPACQDHKRRFENDKGPNTGGMGAYTPVPLYEKHKESINARVVKPLEQALASGKLSFKGVLFIGILVADDTPYVLEFNARFGDPETQAVLPRLKSDLAEALLACTKGELSQVEMQWDDGASICVVACARAYPESSSKDQTISINHLPSNVQLFHAGTKMNDGIVTTNGGRVLGMTGLGKNLSEAAKNAYQALESVSFSDMDYRSDIGGKAIRSIAPCQ